MAASASTTAAVRIVALGGLGEIGLNLMAIECAGCAIAIDCGLMFSDEPELVKRVSGSRPRLPMRITLFTDAAIFATSCSES